MCLTKAEIEDIARVCHEANRAYCLSLGDASQKAWEDAPAWQKESAVNGVEFRLDNPDSPPSASHENWSKEKLEAGWKYGPAKDEEKKEHHCLVPYGELPIAQRRKDMLFQAVVDALGKFVL